MSADRVSLPRMVKSEALLGFSSLICVETLMIASRPVSDQFLIGVKSFRTAAFALFHFLQEKKYLEWARISRGIHGVDLFECGMPRVQCFRKATH